MAESIGSIVNSFGVGRFSVAVMLTVSMLWIQESSILNLSSILGPELQCWWDLSSFEVKYSYIAVFLGQGIGALYWGYLGDIHGRKKIMVAGSVMTVYFTLLTAIAPRYIWYIVLRFFVGIGVSSVIFSMAYISEFIVQKHRGKAVTSLAFLYAIGSFYIVGVAILAMQKMGWRICILFATIPAVLFLCMSYWLPESVQYLQNTGKYDEIVKIINKMSRLNNVPVKASPYFQCMPSSKLGNLKFLLFSKQYFWKMAIMLVVSVSALCGYYALVLMTTGFLRLNKFCEQNATATYGCHRVDINGYLQNMVVTASEVPGILLPFILVDRVGRKVCLLFGFMLSGIGFLCLNFCLLRRNVIFLFVLRFILVGLSQLSFVVSAELFPTIVRTSALGILFGLCKFCFIGVLFLVPSIVHDSMVFTTVIFSVPSFVSAVLVQFLPETKNSALPNI